MEFSTVLNILLVNILVAIQECRVAVIWIVDHTLDS